MSEKDSSTSKEPVLKRLKIDDDSKTKMKEMITANSKPSKNKVDATNMNISQLENLPNEILLKIFNYMDPKIKELLLLGHVSRRIKSVAHDHSLWQNVNLFPKRSVPTGLLQMILDNGCKRLNTCIPTVGTLKLNQESRLEFFSTWHTDHRILNVLLKSCHSLKQLHLNSITLSHDMISSICYQNGNTLKVLKLAEWSSDTTRSVPSEWIRLIIDNCFELTVLDLSNTYLSEESIEYVAKNVTQKVSKLWLTGIKSDNKCRQIVEILEDRCNNLNELQTFEFRIRSGTIYGIGSHSKEDPKEQDYWKKMRDIVSTFRQYE